MSYSKKDIINLAFEEIGLAGYIFDLQPEQLQSALSRLDLMMADWSGKGINIGYPISSSRDSNSINEEIIVPDTALEAIYTNLAKKIAPQYGKTLSAESKSSANRSYKNLVRENTTINTMQLDNLPQGAGNKSHRYLNRDQFINKDPSVLKIADDGNLNLGE